MDKTSVIVVSSCVALLGLHWWYNSTPQEAQAAPAVPQSQPALTQTLPAPEQSATPAQTDKTNAPAPEQQPTTAPAQTDNAAATTPEQPATPAAEKAPAATPQQPTIAPLHELVSRDSQGNEIARFTIQNIGGGVMKAQMVGQKVDSNKPEELGDVYINGLTPEGKQHFGIGTLMFNLSDDNDPIFDNSLYHKVSTGTDTSVTIAAEGINYNGCTFNVTKTYSVLPLQQGSETLEGNAYALRVDINLQNTGTNNLVLSNWGFYGGSVYPVNDNESSAYTYYITLDEGDFENEGTGAFSSWFGSDKKRIYDSEFDKLEWAGLMNQYYATIIQPARNSGTASGNAIYTAPADYKLPGADSSVKGLVMGFGMPATNLAPGASQSFAYETFTGPKYNLLLADMTQEFRMIDDIMDYGWVYLISYPMNWMINTFSGWFGNWGVAIIVMTFVIRLLIWPLYRKSYMSMKRMSLLQPMMQEIKQRCGDDRQRASMEMMALYRKYNISPLGGCLPMLLQIPIFFAFFYVLQTAAELRGAHFLFWVTDLSQPDTVCHILGLPLNILPFIMAASMIIMMKMSPSAGDPMQQKIMKWMPVLFFLFCYTYPSALALYWTTTNIISIIQTLIIRRLPQPTLEQVAADAKTANKNKKEGFFAKIQRMAEEQQKQLEAQKRGNMRNVTKKKK